MQICASGRRLTALSKLPAGVTNAEPAKGLGSALPHALQKLRAWRVPSTANVFTFSAPESQRSAARDENRLAACADPVPFRQRPQ